MKTNLRLLFLAVFGFTATAQAQLVFDFDNATSGVPTGWTVTAVTRGNTTVGSISNTFSSDGATGGTTQGTYTGASGGRNISNGTVGGNAAAGTSVYFEVTITPSATEQVIIDRIRLGNRSSSGTGPTSIVVKTNLDGYSAVNGTVTVTRDGLWYYYANNLSTTITGAIGQAITIRLYADGTTSSASSVWRMDDLAFAGPGVLPVELTAFTGKSTTYGPQLSWSTASETNNDHFEILRSTNGTDFTSITKVDGAGTTTSAKSYTYVDAKAAAGTNYYQLKQVDKDGTAKVFPTVVAVKSDLVKSELILSLANGKQEVDVTVTAGSASKGIIKIYNTGGQLVASKEVTFVAGFNKITLPVASLSNGVYIANVNLGGQVLSKKFIK